MLLLYLYTFEAPNFIKLHPERIIPGEAAMKIGDKYNLPKLVDAGQQCLLDLFEGHVEDWRERKPPTHKGVIVKLLEKLWKVDYGRKDSLRKGVMKRLALIANQIVHYSPFLDLCIEKPKLCIAFMKAQAAHPVCHREHVFEGRDEDPPGYKKRGPIR